MPVARSLYLPRGYPESLIQLLLFVSLLLPLSSSFSSSSSSLFTSSNRDYCLPVQKQTVFAKYNSTSQLKISKSAF